jgi:hypothetical protein
VKNEDGKQKYTINQLNLCSESRLSIILDEYAEALLAHKKASEALREYESVGRFLIIKIDESNKEVYPHGNWFFGIKNMYGKKMIKII